jgi:hypothetical protein
MKKLLPLLILAVAGTSVPAYAAWDDLGRVEIHSRHDRDSQNVRLGGAVERLRLTAEGGNVECRSVRAEFGNGRSSEIFQGTLRQNRATDVDLPGDRRTLRNLSFRCGTDRGAAVIRIFADVGRYRDEWRRNPDFARMWGRAFNWGSEMVNDWHYLGTEKFSGRRDRENSFAGWGGRRIDAVALKPVGADARCSRVVAHFRNGQVRPLDVNRGNVLQQGQYYKLDLPGGIRNLESLSLRCRPLNDRNVNIQIFTSN